MAYAVKSYGCFNPYYVKLYGDFGQGLKVIMRRAVTAEGSGETTTGDDEALPLELPEGLGDEPEEELVMSKSSKGEKCSTHLLLAWKLKCKKRKYYLLIEIEDVRGDVFVYKLYSSNHKQIVEDALQEVLATLTPIATIPLTCTLLKALVLPRPKSITELHPVVSKYVIGTAPKGEKEWGELLGSASNEKPLKHHIRQENAIGLLKSSKGHDLILGDPITGTTLLQLAVEDGHCRLRETLEHLTNVLTSEDFHSYINRCNKDGFSTILTRKRRSISVAVKPHPHSSSSIDGEAADDDHQASINAHSTATTRVRSKSVQKIYPFELGGVTPLMLATRKGCVRSVHYLLVAGADPNYQEPVKGMTSLHIAAVTCNVGITKLLLSFDGDLTLIDTDGNTPLDIARERDGEKAMECLEVMETVAKLRRPGRLDEQIADEASMSDDNVMITATINPLEEIDTDDEEVRSKPKTISQENQPPNEEGISLLSFDGGGTRGSISAYILCVIEQRMRALTNDPDLQIGRYFNWFAGTSIGSFLALCMSHNNASPNTLMTAIVNNRDQIVKGKRIYSSDALEFYAKRLANGEREIRSVSEPKVLITTVRADRDPPRLEFITNYREESLDERNWKVWEAIRASSAAPTFFHSFDDKYVDGSLLAVVPATHAMADIHKYGGNRKLDLVLSLGTGEASTGRPLSIDLKLPKLRNFASTLKSDLQYVSGLFSMISAGFTYTEGDTNVANAWCGMIGANYYHLSPPFSKHLPIDEVKDESFVLMFYETYIYCLENDQKINAIAETLLKLGPRRHY